MIREDRLVVGVTGSFGTGKSTVSRLMGELGAYVLHADELAHEALLEGNAVYADIVAAFPEAQEGPSGRLSRRILAEIVFDHEERRKQLEKMIHPYVLQRMTEEAGYAEEKVIVLDVPLLFESGFDQFCDVTVVVTAAQDIVNSRLVERQYPAAQVEKRMRAQMTADVKKKRATYIICNDGKLEETKRAVERLWKELISHPKGAV